MADGDFDERTALMQHTDDGGDDDADTTGRFEPGAASTPGPSEQQMEMTTMNRPPERGSRNPQVPETSFIEGGSAEKTLEELYPNVSSLEVDATFSKTGRLQIRLSPQIARKTEKYHFLLTQDRATGELRENPNLPKKLKEAPTNPTLRQELIEQNEQEAEEIRQAILEDEQIANNENEELAIREQAREKVREKTELENARDRLEGGLSLKEKVKAIFKKIWLHRDCCSPCSRHHNLLSSLSNGLKSVSAGIGNGLKELGEKFGSLLPDLLGNIASFVFRTADQVISFLGKKAWLLILAVAAFLIERVTKRD